MGVIDGWDTTYAAFAHDIRRRDGRVLRRLFTQLEPVIPARADAAAEKLGRPDWRHADPADVLESLAETIQQARPQRVDLNDGVYGGTNYELTPQSAGLAVDVGLIVGELQRRAYDDHQSRWMLFPGSNRYGEWRTPMVRIEPLSDGEHVRDFTTVFGVEHQITLCAAQGIIPNLIGALDVAAYNRFYGPGAYAARNQ